MSPSLRSSVIQPRALRARPAGSVSNTISEARAAIASRWEISFPSRSKVATLNSRISPANAELSENKTAMMRKATRTPCLFLQRLDRFLRAQTRRDPQCIGADLRIFANLFRENCRRPASQMSDDVAKVPGFASARSNQLCFDRQRRVHPARKQFGGVKSVFLHFQPQLRIGRAVVLHGKLP